MKELLTEMNDQLTNSPTREGFVLFYPADELTSLILYWSRYVPWSVIQRWALTWRELYLHRYHVDDVSNWPSVGKSVGYSWMTGSYPSLQNQASHFIRVFTTSPKYRTTFNNGFKSITMTDYDWTSIAYFRVQVLTNFCGRRYLT